VESEQIARFGMSLITSFDPWRSRLCTCPEKYSFNPYTGCEHRCFYCYITSYIPGAHERCMPKKELLRRLGRELQRLDRSLPISMSNSSDPYTRREGELLLTRACLKMLKRAGARVLVITKSDLVVRDADLLAEMNAVVSITITTLDEELAARMEPYAPEPERRLKALEELAARDVKVSCRIDPIIPGVNDEEGALKLLVRELSCIGVEHVTSSSFKPRADSMKRFQQVFPREAGRAGRLYGRLGAVFYLPRRMRLEMMRVVRALCTASGLTFAACREGFPELRTGGSCDASHLLSTQRTALP